MINVNYFIKALKVSWLRRIIQNSQDASWYLLSMTDFQKIFSLGQGSATQLNGKELLQIWAYFSKRFKV